MHRCARLPVLVLAWFLAPALATARGPVDLPVTRARPDHATATSTRYLRRFVSTQLADRLERHARLVSRRSHGQRTFDRERFVERFSRRLLREGGRIDARVLPVTLPLLPWSNDAQVQRVIDRGKTRNGSARDLYVYLERQTARLRGSTDPAQQQLAGRLTDYLAGYKEGWAAPWIAERLKAFKPGSVRLAVDFRPEVAMEQRRKMGHKVAAARRILRRTVHPKLLKRLSRVEAQVGTQFGVPGIIAGGDGKRRITLRPESDVKDVLHEYGHMVGFRGGLRPVATAHAVLTRRAQGTAPEPLSQLIPNTSYGPQQTGYRGGFVEPYVGRHYTDGFTEVLSMGLEKLSSPQRAAQLFKQDGEYFLLLLKALQRP